MKRLFVLRGQDEVWRNLLREMGERLKDGKALAVEVDDYKFQPLQGAKRGFSHVGERRRQRHRRGQARWPP